MVDQHRPTEPGEEASLVGKPLSRRHFLKMAGAVGATAGLGAGLGGLVAACGGGTTTSTPGSTSSLATSTTVASDVTTVSTGPEAGRDIKVGLVTSQTGGLAAYAVSDDWQIKHAENAVKDGVLCGDGKLHKLQILVRDSMSDSNRAAQVGGDLINNDHVDIMLASGPADTVNPVADQCEALGKPSLSNSTPWESYYFGRGATPTTPFKWTYAVGLGVGQLITDFIDIWSKIPTNKVIGLWFSNTTEAPSWRDEKTGMPPACKAAGFSTVQPQMYNVGTEDFTDGISQFKKAGCEIQFGTFNDGDFSNFWKQCLQQSYHPVLMGAAKCLGTPQALDALGPIGLGLYTAAGWTPSFPFKDTLTGMSSQELADEYEQMTNRQWSTVIQQYPRFEWLVDVLKRTKDVESGESILTAIASTKMTMITGPVDFTSPAKMGTSHPVPNACLPQMPAGQWRKGDKHSFDFIIVGNAAAPLVTVQSKVEPMVYS